MSILDRSDRPSRICVGLGATMLMACSPEPTVDIIGSIEMSTEAVHVDEAGGGTHAIGLLDDAVILSGLVNAPDAPRLAPFGAVAQWFDLHGEPLGPPSDLGFSAGYPQGWVRFEDALHAQYWGDPERRQLVEDRFVHLLRARPGEEVINRRITMELAPPPADCAACGQLWFSSDRALPTLALGDRVIGALGGMPGFPGCTGLTNYERLHLFDSVLRTGRFIDWTGRDPCSLSPAEAGRGVAEVPFLVRLASGEPAVLLRWADFGVYLLHLDPVTLAPMGTPRRVGDPRGGGSHDQPQPQAAVVGNRIIFTDQMLLEFACHRLRVTDDDGSNARDTPWQLPCATEGTDRWITLRPSLVGVRDGVIVVWDQRSAPLYFEDPVSSHADYEEGIYAVLLTPDGRRGSEIVEITSPEHTTVIDDVPSQYAPMVAVDGERVAVAWIDARVDAPGVYLRLLNFARAAEPSDDD